MTTPLYPLLFDPILKEKVWGGRRLAGLGKDLPPGSPVGESWELADLATTAPSGGGGGEARSRVRNGPLAGVTLHDLVVHRGEEVLGPAGTAPGDDFPLLVKYLDAAEHLSVQVHPDREYVAAHPRAHLKSESWYVVEAEEGAVLYKGLRAGVSRDDVTRAVSAGRVPDLLAEVPAVAGECHHLPSGTVHALGAGVLVAEIQTPSDTTFRIYDWAEEYGRSGRPLHVTEALESMDFGAPPPATALESGVSAAMLVATGHFWVAALQPGEEAFAESPAPASWRVVMVTAGAVTVEAEAGSFPVLQLRAGDTALVPAVIAREIRLGGDRGAVALLVGSGALPDLG